MVSLTLSGEVNLIGAFSFAGAERLSDFLFDDFLSFFSRVSHMEQIDFAVINI